MGKRCRPGLSEECRTRIKWAFWSGQRTAKWNFLVSKFLANWIISKVNKLLAEISGGFFLPTMASLQPGFIVTGLSKV